MIDNSTPHNSTEYDEKVIKTIPYYTYFHRETIDLVATAYPEVKLWLDTGCGTGFLAEMAISYFPKCTFLMADPSENMLSQAGKRLKNKSNIRFLPPVSTQQLHSYISKKPEIITSIQAHHYLTPDEREKATKTCYQLLDKNGIFITFENIKPQTGEGIKLGLERWMNFQIAMGRDKKIVAEHRKRFDSAYFPITVSQHITLLKSCGFRTTELFWYSHMQAGFFAIK